MIPQSLGFVTVASAGTPQKLSATPLQASGVRIQPRSAQGVINVGNIILKNSSGRIFAVLSPEQVQPFPLGDTDLAQVYVDADNSGDGVLVSYWT